MSRVVVNPTCGSAKKSTRIGSYEGPVCDFHVHLHLHLDDFSGGATTDCQASRASRACRALADPLRPWLKRIVWGGYEFSGYRYLVRRGSPFEKPMERVLGRILRAVEPQTAADLLARMDRLGIERSIVLALPPWVPNAVVLDACRGNPRMIPFICPTPRGDPRPPGQQVAAGLDAGGRGVKLHPVLQGVPVDGAFCIEAVQAAARADVPVVVHAGGSGHLFGRPCWDRQDPQAFRRLAAAVPEARIVVAHTGLWEYPQIIAAVRNCTNVWLDISFQHPSVIRQVHEAVGTERMMMGSDSPIGRPDIVLQNLARCGFSSPTLSRILWENAAGLL